MSTVIEAELLVHLDAQITSARRLRSVRLMRSVSRMAMRLSQTLRRRKSLRSWLR